MSPTKYIIIRFSLGIKLRYIAKDSVKNNVKRAKCLSESEFLALSYFLNFPLPIYPTFSRKYNIIYFL